MCVCASKMSQSIFANDASQIKFLSTQILFKESTTESQEIVPQEQKIAL